MPASSESKSAPKQIVFIAYSHRNDKWKDRLLRHLRVLERAGLISIGVDTILPPGVPWRSTIEKAIDDAKVALVILCQDAMNSDVMRDFEFPRLEKRFESEGLRVFPIYAQPCNWRAVPWFERAGIFPMDNRPLASLSRPKAEKLLVDLTERVQEAIGEIGRTRVPAAETSPTRDYIYAANRPETGASHFVGRAQELTVLDDRWTDKSAQVLMVTGPGGAGKTSVINRWFSRMKGDHFRQARRVYVWSFYNQGTDPKRRASSAAFFAHALRWFGAPAQRHESPASRAARLVRLIEQQPTLLILDGLEPLQSVAGGRAGFLTDRALKLFLNQLAAVDLRPPSLCVITSRVPVADLHGLVGSSVTHLPLHELPPEAATQLLRDLGVHGPERRLQRIVEMFRGHALSLTLFGSYLKRVHDGDVHRFVRGSLRVGPSDDEHDRVRSVMNRYVRSLRDTPELAFLKTLGLFDRPVELRTLHAVLAKGPISGVTERIGDPSSEQLRDWAGTLRDQNLLEITDRKYSCHPLIRQFFSDSLRRTQRAGWTEAHRRLYEYFATKPQSMSPQSEDDFQPIFEAVIHACAAGLHQEGFDLYWNRLCSRSRAFRKRPLGASEDYLRCLSAFYEDPWSKVSPNLSEENKALLLLDTGHYMFVLGWLEDGYEILEEALERLLKLRPTPDWVRAATAARLMREIRLVQGRLGEAKELAINAAAYGQSSQNPIRIVVERASLAQVHHYLGDPASASIIFRDAEQYLTAATQRKEVETPEGPMLNSFAGYWYCDFLLDELETLSRRSPNAPPAPRLVAGVGDLLHRGQEMKDTAESQGYRIDAGMGRIILARATFLKELHQLDISSRRSSIEHANRAVADVRWTSQVHHLAEALLTRAHIFRMTGMAREAWTDLEETRSLAHDSGLNLYMVDYHIEAAWLALAGERTPPATNDGPVSPVANPTKLSARGHLDKAEKLVTAMAYHRRDQELDDLRNGLGS